MLLIASESVRGSGALNDIVREMSLCLSYFSKSGKLAELMEGPSRRITLITEADVCEAAIDLLSSAAGC